MNNTKSKNILHVAKRQYISAQQMHDILKNVPIKNQFIGALPPQILANIPKQSRATITQQTDVAFSDFACSVSYIDVDTDVHYFFNLEYFQKNIDKFRSNLETIFDQDISVSYIGSGAYKHCFQIHFDCDPTNSYVLQTFQYNICSGDLHGVLIEPQKAFYVYKNYSHGRVAKPFMARPSTKEFLPDGYILTKYIGLDHKYKTALGRINQFQKKTIYKDANRDNLIQGIIVDIGGFKENPEHIANKKIKNHINELSQILDCITRTTTYSEKIFSHLLKKYKRYNDRFFNTELWPKFTRKFHSNELKQTKQTLKSLKHFKDKCDKLRPDNDWTIIRKYIHTDVYTCFHGSALEILSDILSGISHQTKKTIFFWNKYNTTSR